MQRHTAQRDAILAVFRANDRPLSVNEVLAAAARKAARIGQATVYRAIHLFVEEGLLQPVELPGAPPRYELAGKAHHHHFHCRTCDKVYDVPGCSGHATAHVPRAFRVKAHEVMLYGDCPDCR